MIGGALKRDWRFLALLSVVSSALLAFRIGRQSLWLDEFMSLEIARASWTDVARFFTSLPEQHPLYYLLLRAWIVFGTSEAAVRALSALFAVASVWLLYQLTIELLDREVARVAAALLAISPFFIYYGQEARMYSLVAFLAIVCTLFLVRWLAVPTRGGALAYVVVGILGVYTHIFFFFLLFAHAVFVVIRDRSISRTALRLAFLQGLVVIAYLPWAVLIATHLGEGQVWKTWRHVVFGIPYTALRFVVGYGEFVANYQWQLHVKELIRESAITLAMAAVAAGALVMAGIARLVRTGAAGVLVLSGLFVPMLAAVLASVAIILVGERYFIVSFPFFAIVLAVGIVEFWRVRGRFRPFAIGTLALFAGVTVRSLYSYYFNPNFGKEQWAQVAALLREESKPGDIVIVHEGYVASVFEHYYHGEGTLPVYRSGAKWQAAACDAPRTWVVIAHIRDTADFRSRFAATHVRAETRMFPFQSGIGVSLLERRALPTPRGFCVSAGSAVH